MAERPKHRRRGERPRGTPDAGSRRGRDPLEEGRVAAEVARTAAETTRERAERAGAAAEGQSCRIAQQTSRNEIASQCGIGWGKRRWLDSIDAKRLAEWERDTSDFALGAAKRAQQKQIGNIGRQHDPLAVAAANQRPWGKAGHDLFHTEIERFKRL